jgi:DNA-binding response OmpR family regulator
MQDHRHKRRLDEILLEQELITEDQIKDALLRQKAHGGRFGSQLIYHRYIDEASLVQALEIQFECAGVVLSECDIPPALCEMIPKRIALARRVMPFEYDDEENVLRIACEDPTDRALINEIRFVAKDKKIELYVAAEIALNAAISRCYLGQDVSLDDSLQIEIPDDVTESGSPGTSGHPHAKGKSADRRRSILLVTDEVYSAQHLQSLFERDKYIVFSAESPEQARGLVEERAFYAIFIKNDVPGDHIDLINRVRRLSPNTIIRYYRQASSLILGEDTPPANDELVIKNNDLVTSLLSSKAGLSSNHSGRVGRYAETLCRKLEIPDTDRLLIANAAYLHDFAKYYYGLYDENDNRRIIQLTVKLLSSIHYPSQVLDILRAMYGDVGDDYNESLPLEILGGNILSICDLFCDSIPENEQLTLDRFDVIKRRLRGLKNRLFLPDVVDAFINIIQEELLDRHTVTAAGQILVHAQDVKLQHVLELRLTYERFRVIGVTSIEELLKLYQRSKPDLMLLALTDDVKQGILFIDECETRGVDFAKTPCFVVMKARDITNHIDLLDRGIEDIVAHDENYDLLITKIRRLTVTRKSRATAAGAGENLSGARGSLVDVNLIDLVQALGPGLKTVKITVQPASDSDTELVVFLTKGAITHAKLRNLEGADAIYEGLTWIEGTWIVEPVTLQQIPDRNNTLSNESILMEGCRRLDEKIKSGKLL